MAEREGSPVGRSSAQSKTKQDAVILGCAGNKRSRETGNAAKELIGCLFPVDSRKNKTE